MKDAMIVELLWQRSEDAIPNMSERYGAYLTRIAVNILARDEEAEECVNDTYFAAWRQIPPDRPRKLLPYLGRITRCLALNRYDYLTAKKRNADFDIQLSELEECLSSFETVESQYEGKLLSHEISVFLRMIDAEKRHLFIRRYWFSDSISTLAQQFGISESKVKSTLFRVRKQLKAYLEQEGYQL